MRLVDVRYLWLQQAVQEGKLDVQSVPTVENWLDMFTKALTQMDADLCCKAMGFYTGVVGSSRHRKLGDPNEQPEEENENYPPNFARDGDETIHGTIGEGRPFSG